jgi:hypothetical protein
LRIIASHPRGRRHGLADHAPARILPTTEWRRCGPSRTGAAGTYPLYPRLVSRCTNGESVLVGEKCRSKA